MLMPCKICEDPEGQRLIEAIAEGKISITDAAKKLGVTFADFEIHIKNHMEEKPLPRPRLEEGEIDIGRTLRETLRLLKARVSVFMQTEVTPENERMLTALVKEVRGLVMNIAELEGKLSGQPLIELKTIKMQFNDLTGFMITELCPVCKAKIQNRLEEMAET